MKSFVVLLVMFGFSYGGVEISGIDSGLVITDIHIGDTEVYKKKEDATKKGWKKVGKDEKLNIHWYESTPSVQLAFDGLGVLAGARLVIPKEKENAFYKNSEVFEEKTISEKPYYVSTVLLTDPDLVKGKGRQTTEDDEIVESIRVKHKDGELRIQRNACENAKPKVFLEQGCQNKYGLVFSPLKKDAADCDSSFFLVYNEEQNTGELLGFGWLVKGDDVNSGKLLTDQEIQTLFPSVKKCVKGKSAVNVWLSKKASENAECHEKEGEFVKNRCEKKRRGGGDTNY